MDRSSPLLEEGTRPHSESQGLLSDLPNLRSYSNQTESKSPLLKRWWKSPRKIIFSIFFILVGLVLVIIVFGTSESKGKKKKLILLKIKKIKKYLLIT